MEFTPVDHIFKFRSDEYTAITMNDLHNELDDLERHSQSKHIRPLRPNTHEMENARIGLEHVTKGKFDTKVRATSNNAVLRFRGEPKELDTFCSLNTTHARLYVVSMSRTTFSKLLPLLVKIVSLKDGTSIRSCKARSSIYAV